MKRKTASVTSRVVENPSTTRANYGDTASGRYLTDEFAKEPFGWDFEAVRLFVVCLLRAGKIEATSKGQIIKSVAGIDAKDLFSNNNLFRQASFRPKKGIEFEELVKASEAFRDTFGSEVRELSAGAIAAELRRQVERHEDTVTSALAVLRSYRLPGVSVLEVALDQMKAILRGSEDNAIAAFNASHRSIKDAIKRGAEIEQALSEPRLRDLDRARQVLQVAWPFLEQEPDLTEEQRAKAGSLQDLLDRETFFRELPSIEQYTRDLEHEYQRRFDLALSERVKAYTNALNLLIKTTGWDDLSEDQKRSIAAPLQRGTIRDGETQPIPQLRSKTEACQARLKAAIAEVLRLIEGERVAAINLGSYFAGGIETEEQLDAALTGIREECARLIGEGKKVFLQ